jgi:hypothetical protein
MLRSAEALIVTAATDPTNRYRGLAQGQETLLNDETSKVICNALSQNMTLTAAAGLTGVSVVTVRDWIRKGRSTDVEPYAGFVAEMDKAVAFAQAKLVKKMNEASEAGDTRATTFLLERRHREDWGRVDKVEHQHDVSPVVIELTWPGQGVVDPASEVARVSPPQPLAIDAEVVDDGDSE